MPALIESFDRILSTGVEVNLQESSLVETWQAVAAAPIFDPYTELEQYVPALLTANKQHPALKLVAISFPDQDVRLPNVQMVIQRYSNRIQLGDGQRQDGQAFVLEPNPLKEPAFVDAGFWTTNKDFTSDLDEKPFCTTAGEELLHNEEVEYQMWNIKKKVPKYPAIFGSPKNGSRMFINSDKVSFAGEKWDKFTLLIRQIRLGEITQKNNFYFFPLSYTMMYNPDTWLVKKLNTGYTSLQPVLSDFNKFAPNLKKYVLKPAPIKIGDPPQYPNRPVPIQNKPGKTDIFEPNGHVNGMVFPEFLTRDPQGMPTGITDKAEITAARLKEIWKEIVLTFRTREAIKFTGNVPLK